jgi:hypothetical protein
LFRQDASLAIARREQPWGTLTTFPLTVRQDCSASGTARRGGVAMIYNLFCIGTGHTAHEPNQTMVQLYNDCKSQEPFKKLVDGPTNKLGNAYLGEWAGAGMDDSLKQVLEHMSKARGVLQVNMAGHSRGGVLCHMVARRLFELRPTLPVNIATLDPVHMSFGHGDVTKLPANVQKYQAIVMENDNNPFFSLQKLEIDDEDAGKVYFINMPGTHGSGTQILTSAIGKICYELIANFMRKRGTEFDFIPRNALQMCGLFARIHQRNGWTDLARTKRKIFDDYGDAAAHDTDREWEQGSDHRAGSVAERLAHNMNRGDPDLPKGGRFRKDLLMSQFGNKSYFINQKHAKFFKKEFPFLWQVIAYRRKISPVAFAHEIGKMKLDEALNSALPLLDELLYSRMPQGFVHWRQSDAPAPSRSTVAPVIGRRAV